MGEVVDGSVSSVIQFVLVTKDVPATFNECSGLTNPQKGKKSDQSLGRPVSLMSARPGGWKS